MKHAGLFFISLFLLCELTAQTDYRPGYIMSLSGDTVYGKIDYRGNRIMGRICRFESNDGVRTEYAPGEIQAYRFIDNKYFVSRKVDNQTYFLEYLIKGKMSIYYLQDDDLSDHYYVETEELSLKKIPYTEEFRYVDKYSSRQRLYRSIAHVGLLNYLTKEAPQLRKSINKMGSPSHNNLIKVAKNYHNATCEAGEKCTVYARKSTFKVQIEPTFGYYFWMGEQRKHIKEIGYSSGFLFGGATVHLLSPVVSENWYFKTGILYSHLMSTVPSNSESFNLFVLPLQLEYVYPKGQLRPTFSGGVNMYFETGIPTLVSSYSAGLLTQLNTKTSFIFNLGLEMEPHLLGKKQTIPVVIIPNYKLLGLTLSVGVKYTLN